MARTTAAIAKARNDMVLAPFSDEGQRRLTCEA
jgi:hypothetical protein